MAPTLLPGRVPGRCAAGLACLFALAGGAGAADECSRLPLPSVTLKRLPDAVGLDTHYGYREITHLAAELARPETRVLGLTRGTAMVHIEIKAATYADASGRWQCASPQLLVTYGYQPMTVYIAREFRQGSCAYEQIYQHELRHVQAYQRHLEAIEPELRATLTRRFATGAPWRGPLGPLQTALQRELDERWIPYLRREMGKVEAAQAMIDTRAEYERVANSCNGEIRRVIR